MDVPGSVPSVRPSLLAVRTAAAGQRVIDAFTDAWQTGVLAPERLRTGCIYESQPADSYLIAVMRFDPRLSGRRQVPIHEWWPTLAPEIPLLNAYRHMDAHGQRQIQWPEFARRYLAGLDLLPTQLLVDLIRSFGMLPSRYKTVTLLCCEHATAADERRVRCHRRLLRHWLLGEAIADVPDVAASGLTLFRIRILCWLVSLSSSPHQLAGQTETRCSCLPCADRDSVHGCFVWRCTADG